MKYNKLLFFILLLLVTAGCSRDNDNDDGDFYKPFVGQWQEIAEGNKHYPGLPPSGRIIEFFENGTSTYYTTQISTCRTDAEFLYLNSGKDPDGHTFQYALGGPDNLRILRLDVVDGLVELSMRSPTFYIFKRIK
jgi:hypothetical protein